MKLICKKSLYKSTYKDFAFKKDKEYEIDSQEDSFIFMKDEKGNTFSFAKRASNIELYYLVDDYFNGT